MEWDKDDLDLLHDIQNASPEFIQEAIDWWNGTASQSIKRFIAVTCYYEWLALQSDDVDYAVQSWEDDAV